MRLFARIFTTALLAAGILVVVGMFLAALAPQAPPSIYGPPDADAKLRVLTKGDVRARSRVTLGRWCRRHNIRAKIPVAPGVFRRVRVSKCEGWWLTPKSCWADPLYRRGECAGEIKTTVFHPWHGQPHWPWSVTRWCADSVLVWQKPSNRTINARMQGDEECWDDMEAKS